MHCSQWDKLFMKKYLYFYFAPLFSQCFTVESHNSFLKIFKVKTISKLADGAATLLGRGCYNLRTAIMEESLEWA